MIERTMIGLQREKLVDWLAGWLLLSGSLLVGQYEPQPGDHGSSQLIVLVLAMNDGESMVDHIV